MLKISYGLYDVTALEDSQPSAADIQPFAAIEQIKEDIEVEKYGTGEWNQFLLNGQYQAFPDEPELREWGLFSEAISDVDAACSVILDVGFTEVHSSLGLTFFFGEYWPSEMTIRWYDAADSLLLDKQFRPDRQVYLAEGQVEDYKRLEIEFVETSLPYRYVRLEKLLYGTLKEFSGDDIISAHLLEEIDPIAGKLPINTLDFQIYASDFAILDPQGLYAMLQRRQEIEIKDKSFLGLFYLDEPSAATDETASFSCTDALGVLDSYEYMGGIYEAADAGDLIKDICEGFSVELDPAFDGAKRSGWLPIGTRREALRQIAFGLGAIIDCSRSKKITVRPLPLSGGSDIEYKDKIAGHKLKMLPLITGVEVHQHQYREADEVQTVINDEELVGTYTYRFDKPLHSLVCNATIVESGANYAVIEASGLTSLTGKKYEESTTVYTVSDPLPANELPNVMSVKNAYMVADGQAVADRLFNYYQNRYEGSGDFILAGQRAGDLIKMDSLNGYQVEGTLELLDIDLVASKCATLRIRGKRAE